MRNKGIVIIFCVDPSIHPRPPPPALFSLLRLPSGRRSSAGTPPRRACESSPPRSKMRAATQSPPLPRPSRAPPSWSRRSTLRATGRTRLTGTPLPRVLRRPRRSTACPPLSRTPRQTRSLRGPRRPTGARCVCEAKRVLLLLLRPICCLAQMSAGTAPGARLDACGRVGARRARRRAARPLRSHGARPRRRRGAGALGDREGGGN